MDRKRDKRIRHNVKYNKLLMATIQLSDGGRYLSAALPESIMVTGTPPVTLCITDEDDGILYNQKFHVGSFSFHELREVIESHMRQRHKCISSLEVAATDSVTNVAKQIQVAFATQLPSGAGMQEFAERYFLTPATARRVPEEATVSLVALTFGKTETLSATLCYVKENGRSGVSRMENPGFIQSDMDYPQQLCITVSVMEAAALLADEMPGATLTSLTVELGSRSASFFIDRKMHATPPLRIEFLNCFNASDAVWLPAVMERSVTLDYSEGSVGHRLVAYDFEENTEFDVTTAGLTSGEALLLEQALVSRNVLADACYVDGKKTRMYSALLSDAKFSTSNDPESPPTGSFTIRFAGRTRRFDTGDCRIFTEQFTPPFA